MSHSMVKIWIHIVFGTKERQPMIKSSFENDLYNHIKILLEEDFDCEVKIINGTADHIHLLLLQNQKYSISEIVKNIKGNSSHWINQSGFMSIKFSWQTGYGAFSISESMEETVERYIENQKEHHKKITFAEEYRQFAEKYKVEV